MSYSHFHLLLLQALAVVGCSAALLTAESTLSVSGRGEVMIPTTLAEVSLGMQVDGHSSAEAQNELAAVTARVLAQLRELKVEKLRTKSARVQPQQAKEPPHGIVGYQASQQLLFTAPIDRVGGVIDQAIVAGANQVRQVIPKALDTALREARDEALKIATEVAVLEANVVAASLNSRLGAILAVEVAPDHYTSPLPRFALQEGDFSFPKGAVTEIIGGDQKVTASVTLKIELKQ